MHLLNDCAGRVVDGFACHESVLVDTCDHRFASQRTDDHLDVPFDQLLNPSEVGVHHAPGSIGVHDIRQYGRICGCCHSITFLVVLFGG